ncbi:MAG: PilZ domain-containing protein [Bdellovibrionaceae bacterium]|nr:PilZ domain-containing protein [Pseudobdellovibrionaceae bacterium]
MNKKPLCLYIIPAILVGLAFSFYAQVSYLLDLHWLELQQVVTHIPLINWMTMGLLVTSAYLIYKANRYAKLFVPLTITCVGWNNYLVGSYQENYSAFEALWSASLFPFLFTPLLSKKIRDIFQNKQTQWWQTAPRKPISAHVAVNPFVSTSFNSKTYDISKTGLFINLKDLPWENLPKLGERVNMNITLDTLRKVRVEAIIVRLDEAKGSYPRGMGLRFTDISKENRKILDNFLIH